MDALHFKNFIKYFLDLLNRFFHFYLKQTVNRSDGMLCCVNRDVKQCIENVNALSPQSILLLQIY